MIEGYKKDIQEVYRWYKGQTRTNQVLIKYLGCTLLIIISLILKAFVSGWFFVTFVLGIGIIAHDVIRQQRQEMKAADNALEDSIKKLDEAKARSRQAFEERKRVEHDFSVQRKTLLNERKELERGMEQQIREQRERIQKEVKDYQSKVRDELKFIKSNIKKFKY